MVRHVALCARPLFTPPNCFLPSSRILPTEVQPQGTWLTDQATEHYAYPWAQVSAPCCTTSLHSHHPALFKTSTTHGTILLPRPAAGPRCGTALAPALAPPPPPSNLYVHKLATTRTAALTFAAACWPSRAEQTSTASASLLAPPPTPPPGPRPGSGPQSCPQRCTKHRP